MEVVGLSWASFLGLHGQYVLGIIPYSWYPPFMGVDNETQVE